MERSENAGPDNVRADRVESVERKESYLLSTLDEATLDDTDGEASAGRTPEAIELFNYLNNYATIA